MNDGRKTRFALIIIGLTLLLMAGISGCIIILIIISTEGLNPERIVLLLSGFVMTTIGLIVIVKQNRAYTKNRVEEARNGNEPFLVKWEIGKEQWSRFSKAKFELDTKESTGNGWAAAGLMGVISGFAFWNKFDLTEVIGYIVLTAGIFFFVGKYGGRLKARSNYRGYSQIEMADVYFGKSYIIFNSKLILVYELGSRIKFFSIQNKFDMEVVEFTIELGLGNRKSTRNYTIPIPEGKIEEANKLSTYYNGIA